MGKKNSTSTIDSDQTIVPWLAASGPLSYSPKNPTNNPYHFQYGWHLPNAFKNTKRHYYFGRSRTFVDNGTHAESYLRDFWQNAVDGKCIEVFQSNGRRTVDGFIAPIACYDHLGQYEFDTGYLLIQQGSYQLIPQVV